MGFNDSIAIWLKRLIFTQCKQYNKYGYCCDWCDGYGDCCDEYGDFVSC